MFETPKIARSRRSITISRRAIDALSAHSDRQAFDRRQAGSEWSEQDHVFCSAFRTALHPSHETATFKVASERAGLPPTRFHDMRHSCATMLLSKGVHGKLISEMPGHTTITFTLDTYLHVIPSMHGDAAAAIDAILSA